jgi:hypothetical protein
MYSEHTGSSADLQAVARWLGDTEGAGGRVGLGYVPAVNITAWETVSFSSVVMIVLAILAGLEWLLLRGRPVRDI